MNYTLVTITDSHPVASPLMLEGMVLAANFATQPLDPKVWLTELFASHVVQLEPLITEQINAQYQQLKANQYSLLSLLSQHAESQEQGLMEFAQGFMSLWPLIEPQWQSSHCSDGSLRMLQALLTTLMLALDEQATQQQMRAAGYQTSPSLADMIEQLDLMVHEVALAADEQMLGAKAQSVNPYKNVGRNELCPCRSGKKFKHCCGQ